jgi:hypothetical protein
MTEEEIVKAKFKQAFDIYANAANDKEGVPILCKIHDAFGGLNGSHHNCLGCNFADSQSVVFNHLSNFESHTNIQESVSLYIITLYLLVERIETVMNIVQVPQVFRDKHFKMFQQIHKWANFIKHPKAFILTHHAEWGMEGTDLLKEGKFKVTINDSFVETYYKGERDPDKQKARNKELYKILRNESSICVVLPDIAKLTEKLCYSLKAFAKLICENQVYIEILNDEATIQDYFENQGEADLKL